MTDAPSPASTRTSRVIKASREALYRAFTDPAALAVWLAPEGMTGKVHEFDGPSWRRISDVAVLSLIQKV